MWTRNTESRSTWQTTAIIYLFCGLFCFVKYQFQDRLGTQTVSKISIWHRYRKNPNNTQPYTWICRSNNCTKAFSYPLLYSDVLYSKVMYSTLFYCTVLYSTLLQPSHVFSALFTHTREVCVFIQGRPIWLHHSDLCMTSDPSADLRGGVRLIEEPPSPKWDRRWMSRCCLLSSFNHTHTHTYIYTHTYTHTYIYIYIYTHTYTHTCGGADRHMHTHTQKKHCVLWHTQAHKVKSTHTYSLKKCNVHSLKPWISTHRFEHNLIGRKLPFILWQTTWEKESERASEREKR